MHSYVWELSHHSSMGTNTCISVHHVVWKDQIPESSWIPHGCTYFNIDKAMHSSLSFIKGYIKQHFTVFSNSYWKLGIWGCFLFSAYRCDWQHAGSYYSWINRYRLKFVSDPHSRRDYLFKSFPEYWSSYIAFTLF